MFFIWKVIQKGIGLSLYEFWHENKGAVVAAFALMAPVVIGSAGAALDLSQAYLVRQRLGGALDASALAAAASSTDQDEITARVQSFFDANYPSDAVGSAYDLEVAVNGDDVTVSAFADYYTSFLGIMGIKEITIYAQATVHREIRGLEVVLVLDNTGSMSSYNNIGALRTASENFVEILFDATEDPNDIRIGLVPYSSSVRIGRYGLGLTPDGDPYNDETVFVRLPPDMNYTNDKTSDDWYGCVVEHHEENYQDDADYVSNSRGQLWEADDGNYDGHGWNGDVGDNDPYDYDVLDTYDEDEWKWDVYSYGKIINENQYCSGSGYSSSRCSDCTGYNNRCDSDNCFCWRSDSNGGTNYNCPYAYIQPLTSDEEQLYEVIDDMEAHGYTYGNIGMAWGMRLLSPGEPFIEGSAWDDENWRKAIIMMTDGDNTMEGTYSAYWGTNKHNIGVDDLNERFEETCDALKAQDVIIYTITFTSNIDEDTKDYYRNCATTEAQYYDAPSQQDLINVFERISRELANLHISG